MYGKEVSYDLYWKSFIYRNIDNVDKTMDEINEQTENLKMIQEALSAPIGAAADFDEVLYSNIYLFWVLKCCFLVISLFIYFTRLS